jgi:hypothetical protein
VGAGLEALWGGLRLVRHVAEDAEGARRVAQFTTGCDCTVEVSEGEGWLAHRLIGEANPATFVSECKEKGGRGGRCRRAACASRRNLWET